MNFNKGFFITGTDTGCGKTEVTLGLMHRLQAEGLSVAGLKPVAAGAVLTPEGLRNDDALKIQAQSDISLPYEKVNPFAYEAFIAPHLAAKSEGRPISLRKIQADFIELSALADRVIVEGVGGWRVPLGHGVTLPDLVRLLNLPVILVVGLKLGCINHTLLTEESILGSGLRLAGWVGNHIDPDMDAQRENIETLCSWMPAPCLGEIPYMEQPTAEAVGECFDRCIAATGLGGVCKRSCR
ncbi:dethiobiotin synthase [endosymbiont of Lamellibrachia barhami]|uniref:dethiobiotin synthase n=1 Tax=endosymbiont of Lamellibrachia barhami TaxID=205975 RepID=UPI0015B311F8|nr:dethiobiotin synthase [endosymbiont of Lamellibrachia barhami]